MNIYHYTFYLLAKFSSKIRKDDSDFAFKGMAFLSIPMGLNCLSFVIFLGGVEYHASKQSIYLISVLILAPIVGMNYYLLMRNRKHEEIIAFFDQRQKEGKSNIVGIFFTIIYFAFSIGICIILAQQNRNIHQ